MGQMPVLDIDGKKLHQSKAICRFLAKKFNLYGKDEFEAHEIDAVVDSVDDMRIGKYADFLIGAFHAGITKFLFANCNRDYIETPFYYQRKWIFES